MNNGKSMREIANIIESVNKLEPMVDYHSVPVEEKAAHLRDALNVIRYGVDGLNLIFVAYKNRHAQITSYKKWHKQNKGWK